MFNKFILKQNDNFKIKIDECIASGITWAFTLVCPWTKAKWFKNFYGVFIVLGKHAYKLFTGNFIGKDFLIDMVIAVIATVISLVLDAALAKKLSKLAKKEFSYSDFDYICERAHITFKIDGLGNTFSFVFNITPSFVQAFFNAI